MRKKAFTLIELLVVVAIIAVLVAILLPALQKVRERARQTICATHLQQMGVNFGYYMNDFNDFFPPAFGYFGNGDADERTAWNVKSMKNYLLYKFNAVNQGVAGDKDDPLLTCPSAPPTEPLPDYEWGRNHRRDYSYNRGWSYGVAWMIGAPNPAYSIPVRLNMVDEPARTVLLAERYNKFGAFKVWGCTVDQGDFSPWEAPEWQVNFRHLGLANFLMVDGHVQVLEPEEAVWDWTGKKFNYWTRMK
jgi:prepilin-type N-terminal cleavage/methylation domain-containing protein/prepilin-type processing-associated H-X9-DG protein